MAIPDHTASARPPILPGDTPTGNGPPA